jgi:hypothetical protein
MALNEVQLRDVPGCRDQAAGDSIAPQEGTAGGSSRRRGVRELVILFALYVAYSATRSLANPDLDAARRRAAELFDAEAVLGLAFESGLNRWASDIAWLGAGMSLWYAALHYIVTPITLYWLYARHPHRYARARTAVVIASVLALIGYVLVPTAPPRLMPTGFVDTLARYADVGWWSEHASAPEGFGHLTNELAAMPSLHVGWAVWVAWALYPLLARPGRWIVIAYAAGTTIVVVATGNHWVLDALAGAAVVWLGIAITRLLTTHTTTDSASLNQPQDQ